MPRCYKRDSTVKLYQNEVSWVYKMTELAKKKAETIIKKIIFTQIDQTLNCLAAINKIP